MKKIASIFCAVLLSAALTACGSGEPASAPSVADSDKAAVQEKLNKQDSNSGHGGVLLILGFVKRRCRSLPPAIQPLTLDNGREILIADIQIHIAVDTCNLALFTVLPDAVSTAVIGLIDPVRQPDRVPRLDIVSGMCGQRRSRAIQSDKIAGVLNLFKECTHDTIIFLY